MINLDTSERKVDRYCKYNMGKLPTLTFGTPTINLVDKGDQVKFDDGDVNSIGIQNKDIEQVIRWLVMKQNSQFDNLPMVLAQIKGTHQYLMIPPSLTPLVAILKESGRIKVPYTLSELSKALQTLNQRLEPEVYQFFAINDIDVTVIS